MCWQLMNRDMSRWSMLIREANTWLIWPSLWKISEKSRGQVPIKTTLKTLANCQQIWRKITSRLLRFSNWGTLFPNLCSISKKRTLLDKATSTSRWSRVVLMGPMLIAKKSKEPHSRQTSTLDFQICSSLCPKMPKDSSHTKKSCNFFSAKSKETSYLVWVKLSFNSLFLRLMATQQMWRTPNQWAL